MSIERIENVPGKGRAKKLRGRELISHSTFRVANISARLMFACTNARARGPEISHTALGIAPSKNRGSNERLTRTQGDELRSCLCSEIKTVAKDEALRILLRANAPSTCKVCIKCIRELQEYGFHNWIFWIQHTWIYIRWLALRYLDITVFNKLKILLFYCIILFNIFFTLLNTQKFMMCVCVCVCVIK